MRMMNELVFQYTISVFLLVLLTKLVSGTNYILRETAKHEQRPDYLRLTRPHPDKIHEITISIHQNNLDKIESLLYEVSDLSSPKYGQYLSQENVGQIVSNLDATNAIERWLMENNCDILFKSTYGEYIRVKAPIHRLEQMFQTEFYEFVKITDWDKSKVTNIDEKKDRNENRNGNIDIVVRAISYSVPEEYHQHIHSVFNMTTLPMRIFSAPIRKPIPSQHKKSTTSTSQFLQSYNYPDYYPYGYPYTIQKYYNIIVNGVSEANQTIYGSLNQTFLPSDISTFQSQFGVPSNPVSNYVGPVPNRNACTNSKTSSNCGEASLDAEYITSIASYVNTTYWYDSSSDFVSFMIEVSNLAYPSLVYSISYAAYEVDVYSNQIASFNTEAMKLGLRGVTILSASGDDGVTGYGFRGKYFSTDQCGYYAMFPASSPYVTAVGGTMYGLSTGQPEIACSVASGSIISSGGGFSNSIPAPSFQKTAINNYFSKVSVLQATFIPYVKTNRGYPDISMPADSIIDLIDDNLQLVWGTSAATPIFAAMVSLVNTARLKAGSVPLGWINPAIYANNGGFTNDITSGNNNCVALTKAYAQCCRIGFQATTSWDPVTGFGSVDYKKFYNYFMSIEPTHSPTSPPSFRPSTTTSSNIPSITPSFLPSSNPTIYPTIIPSSRPSTIPSVSSTVLPSIYPTKVPSTFPTINPSVQPSLCPSIFPSVIPTKKSSFYPSCKPTYFPSFRPTNHPSFPPTSSTTKKPSSLPSISPSKLPSFSPTKTPTFQPTATPSSSQTIRPTSIPTTIPSSMPTITSTTKPTVQPSSKPTYKPSSKPSS